MHKNKGQISLDLIFALIAMIVFIQFAVFFASDFTDNQNKINIRNQELGIALKVKNAFSSCKAVDLNSDNLTDTRITVYLPFINEVGSQEVVSELCSVTVLDGVIEVSHDYRNDEGITESIEVLLDLPEYVSQTEINAECGSPITVSC